MVEILVSVSLMLIIMLGVTQLFSMLSKTLNDTQAALGIVGNLRITKQRLAQDLKGLTVDPSREPPVRLGSNSGFLCIVEGMGAPHSNSMLQTNGFVETGAIAYNSDSTDYPYDNTVGDVDDIISFTAQAPVGQKFRGHFGNERRSANSIETNMFESDLAEITWFVRGSTLYRRVLLIVPNSDLQRQLGKTSNPDINQDTSTQDQFRENLQKGIGFYEYFDVSVHLEERRDSQGNIVHNIVANTLEDLSKRENRFAFGGGGFPHNPSMSSACYYLRVPTLRETSYRKNDGNNVYAWTAGRSFEYNLTQPHPDDPAKTILPRESGNDRPYLTYGDDDFTELYRNPAVAAEAPSYSLPLDEKTPFIDFWRNPNCWSEQDRLTGNLAVLQEHATRFADDVIMTNVISFDVQPYDPVSKRYINLGEGAQGGEMDGESYLGTIRDPGNDRSKDIICGPLGTQGHYSFKKPLINNEQNEIFINNVPRHDGYFGPRLTNTFGKGIPVWKLGNIANTTVLPCIYDTWNEHYEQPSVSTHGKNQFDDPSLKPKSQITKFLSPDDEFVYYDRYSEKVQTFRLLPVDENDRENYATNGVIDDPSEWAAPPPYRVPLRGVKITIRAFEPNPSKNSAIREMTIIQSFTGR